MKLFYYKDPIGNFGDDLNPLIWYTLAPDLFDDDDTRTLLGVGTLINSRAPAEPVKYVLGSGVGYHAFPDIDSKWKFLCVRGPLSAKRIGLDANRAITDPAVLLTQVVGDRAVEKTRKVSFMPHCLSATFADWKGICAKAGLQYLDPASDVSETIFRIRQSRLVIADAMHAAIVADAFRVPWVPVNCYDHILRFKWDDWCQSLNLSYAPHSIPRIYDMERDFTIEQKVKTQVKRALKSVGIWTDNWTPPVPATNKDDTEARVVEALVALSNCVSPILSDDRIHQESIERLLEKIEQLKRL